MTSVIDELWSRYRRSGDPDARRQLLDQYLGLVHHCARGLARRAGHAVSVDDLVGAGTLGLIQALDGFDPSRGLVFSTYAVQRIRGAMLDDLRSRDWMPRTVRERVRKLSSTVAELEARLGRQPSHAEIAARLDVDPETYWAKWVGIEKRHLVPLDADTRDPTGRSFRIEDVIADPDAGDPIAGVTADERRVQLRQAIADLPKQERTVLALYYYERLTLRQIGEVLHVTESRVSQVRGRALRRLRENTDLVQAVS